MSEKKGFVLYFNAYASISSLSDEQREILLLALYRYADIASRREVEAEEVFRQFPALNGESRMAFRFLAGNIKRDTEKWKKSVKNYEQAAQKRKEKTSDNEEMQRYIKELQNSRIWKSPSCVFRRRGHIIGASKTISRVLYLTVIYLGVPLPARSSHPGSGRANLLLPYRCCSG